MNLRRHAGVGKKKTDRISGWSFLIGGGVATCTKTSYINTFGVVRADAERCGIQSLRVAIVSVLICHRH